MSRTGLPLQWLSLLFLASLLFHTSNGDVGTAGWFAPPFIPTACYGDNPSPLPSSNLFAAAGDGIWDNGASCGRQYSVRCISASEEGTCVPDQTIQIKIVDYVGSAPSQPSASGTMVLTKTAFNTIANTTKAKAINIEFQQV